MYYVLYTYALSIRYQKEQTQLVRLLFKKGVLEFVVKILDYNIIVCKGWVQAPPLLRHPPLDLACPPPL